MPEEFWGRRMLLKFGAVDYEAKVWLNGRLLGFHRGGYAPFSFDITGLVRRNRNILTLRVLDKHEEQPRGKQDARLHPEGCLYMRITGIWQTVWIEAVGEAYIDSFKTFPDIDKGEVGIQVDVAGDFKGCELSIKIYFTGVEVGEKSGRVEEASCRFNIPIPRMKLWSPDRPDLYNIEFTLLRGRDVLDHVYGYFGMRKVSVKGDRILLNNQPLYLCMALDQGYYPDGLYSAPNAEALRRDVEAAKALGFNGVRKHQMAPDPLYYTGVIS